MSTWATACGHAEGSPYRRSLPTDRSYAAGRTRARPSSAALLPCATVSTEAKNLEAISRAIDQHNSGCPFPAAEVRLNPFEAERLGWEEIRGLPIVPDAAIGTGRFRIVCSRDLEGAGIEEVEAVGAPVEVGIPAEQR